MGWILGFGIPVGYLTMWTWTARTLYRRYHPIEGEKRNCPRREDHPETHGDGDKRVCAECSGENKQWWQSRYIQTTARGLTDGHLAWDCIVQSFIPPLTLIIFLMYTAVTANPPVSPREAKAREEVMRARIRELECINNTLSDATN